MGFSESFCGGEISWSNSNSYGLWGVLTWSVTGESLILVLLFISYCILSLLEVTMSHLLSAYLFPNTSGVQHRIHKNAYQYVAHPLKVAGLLRIDGRGFYDFADRCRLLKSTILIIFKTPMERRPRRQGRLWSTYSN